MRRSSQRSSQIETFEKMLLMSASGIDGTADVDSLDGTDIDGFANDDVFEVNRLEQRESPVPFGEFVVADVSEAAPEPLSSNDVFLDRVIDLTNDVRAANGQHALTTNSALQATAQLQSVNMAEQDFFSHTGQDGLMAWERALIEGYNYQTIGENIAAGQLTPEEVVQGWVNSPGHLANILNPRFTEIGVGYQYLQNDTGVINYHHYWTQVFGTEFPSAQAVTDVVPNNDQPVGDLTAAVEIAPEPADTQPLPEPPPNAAEPPVTVTETVTPPVPPFDAEPAPADVLPPVEIESSDQNSQPPASVTPPVEQEPAPAEVESTVEIGPPNDNSEAPVEVQPTIEVEPSNNVAETVTPPAPPVEIEPAPPAKPLPALTEVDAMIEVEPPNNVVESVTPPVQPVEIMSLASNDAPPASVTPVKPSPEVEPPVAVESPTNDTKATVDGRQPDTESQNLPPEPVLEDKAPQTSAPVDVIKAKLKQIEKPVPQRVAETVVDVVTKPKNKSSAATSLPQRLAAKQDLPLGLTNLAEVKFFDQAVPRQLPSFSRSLESGNVNETITSRFSAGTSRLQNHSNGGHSSHFVGRILDGFRSKYQNAHDDQNTDLNSESELIGNSGL